MDSMTQYIGILDSSGKTFGVRIPDLPGCYGAGKSPEAALSDAMSAAREWVAHRATKGEAAPRARTLAEILKAEEIDAASNEVAVLVPAIVMSVCSVVQDKIVYCQHKLCSTPPAGSSG